MNIIKTPRYESWDKMIVALLDRGHNVHCATPEEPADLTIVLSGMYENVGILTGRKCLVYHRREWVPDVFGLFRGLLQEYYDDFIEVTNKNLGDSVKAIEDYIDRFKRKTEES